MKKIILLFCVGLLGNVLLGQDTNYSGPAKLHVKSFWEQVAKLKAGTGGSVQNLEKQVKYVKDKDPAYDTNAMEAELKIWMDKPPIKSERQLKEEAMYEKQKQNRENGMNKFKEEQQLSEAIEGTKMTFGTYDTDVEKKMDNYKALSTNVLAIDLSKHTAHLAEKKLYIDRSAITITDQLIIKTKTLLKEVTKKQEFDANYNELRFRQLHWDLLRKIYSEEAAYEKKYQEVTATLNEIGGKEAIEKVAAANNAEKIKNRKLDTPVASDASLEKFVKDAFNATYKSDYGTCLKVVLTQNGWTTERNPITSIITGRNRTTQVAYKGADGKCYLLSGIVFIYEEFNGSTYTNRVIVYKGLGGDEMLCENVK